MRRPGLPAQVWSSARRSRREIAGDPDPEELVDDLRGRARGPVERGGELGRLNPQAFGESDERSTRCSEERRVLLGLHARPAERASHRLVPRRDRLRAIANSALAAAVSPNETETSPSRLARNAAGERASPAYARPNPASFSSSRSVSGAAAGGSVAPNRDHHDDNALDERPVSSRRRWRHPQARRNRRSASRCPRTDRSIAGRVVSRRTARLVSTPALASNARSVATT